MGKEKGIGWIREIISCMVESRMDRYDEVGIQRKVNGLSHASYLQEVSHDLRHVMPDHAVAAATGSAKNKIR